MSISGELCERACKAGVISVACMQQDSTDASVHIDGMCMQCLNCSYAGQQYLRVEGLWRRCIANGRCMAEPPLDKL